MATVTVKRIPDDIYRQLKLQAVANHRSINSEIIVCIERAVANRRVDPTEFGARARNLRSLSAAHPLTDHLLDEAKRSGRP